MHIFIIYSHICTQTDYTHTTTLQIEREQLTSDVGSTHASDIAGRSTNTAAHIQDLHALLDAGIVDNTTLVTQNRILEGLAPELVGEVEGFTPSILVKVRDQIVELGDVLVVLLAVSTLIVLHVLVVLARHLCEGDRGNGKHE